MISKFNNKYAILFMMLFFLIVASVSSLEAQNIGDNWQKVYQDPGLPFRSMACNGSRFVAVGDVGLVMTSDDGKTWTTRNPGTTKNIYGVTYGGGLFVAVGYGGTILTSPNAVTWTARNANLTNSLWAVAHSGSLYVAMGRVGAITTSPDGITWTKGNSGTATEFRDICYGNGLFVAAGSTGGVFTSPDGLTWTKRSVATSNNLYAAIYAGGKFVVGGAHGDLFTSASGVNWTKRNTGVGNYFWQITYADSNFFIACNFGGTDPSAPVLRSPDGINWTRIYTGSNSHLRGIATNGSVVCAGGDRRTVMYSDNTPLPDLTVFSPNGGEKWNVGTTHNITWKKSGPANVKIEYSTNAGSTWKTIIASTPNNGLYSWTVPNDPSTLCRVRVSDAADGTPSDISNLNFTIAASSSGGTLTVTAPNGGETLTIGSTFSIRWISKDVFDGIRIRYSTDGGSNYTKIVDTSNSGSYNWTVPNVNSSNCLIRINAINTDGIPNDVSDSVFTIGSGGGGGGGGASLTVIAPNGGESLGVGNTYTIKWSSANVSESIRIRYSTDGGSNYTKIVDTSNDGSYNWTVPNVSSSNCLIRINAVNESGDPNDTSDSTFSIGDSTPSASISVISPNGGEAWAVGTNRTIKWSTTGTVGNVKIEYTTNNGATWTTIAGSTGNDGGHSWSIPNILSSQCLVRISEASDGSPLDTSNNRFSITEATPPEIVLDRTQLNFGYIRGGAAPCSQEIFISNGGNEPLNWTTTADGWINLDPASGTDGVVVTVSVDPSGLNTGAHSSAIIVSDPNATNSPQTVTVNLKVKNAGQDESPFGDFATPLDGTTDVSGSVAVTGWALDDVCVTSVKIYRQVNGGLSYIGDAVFVEGARPDVEQAYPDYPNNSSAGWGYMMLTNFLPDGELVLKAIATDNSGHEVVLGTKTITVDNENAVKPFGAIDDPTQGGDASGSNFRNNGWALTPMPNKIPENGSTINVYIDGVPVGKATYNIYRSDIATLFPGYANSDGAKAYFDFDTTAYSNGVHTISWSVADNGGNSDGIGSRYFTIRNTGSARSQTQDAQAGRRVQGTMRIPETQVSPVHGYEPINVKKGYNADIKTRQLYPDDRGTIRFEIKELERVVLQLSGDLKFYAGYQEVNNQLRPLPVGSKMDLNAGIFYWQAGPGFTGEYKFVFFTRDQEGSIARLDILLGITPKFSK